MESTKAEHQQFLTPEEVAEVLRISLSTVYRQLKSGAIPAKRFGHAYRIRREWLEEMATV